MSRFYAFASLSMLFLTGCGSLSLPGGLGGGSATPNMAKTMLENYTSGRVKASPIVPVHSGAKAGQFAEWEQYTWSVAAVRNGRVVVEQIFAQGHVVAYEVDPNAATGKRNVTKAWAGIKGEKPVEIEIMQLQSGTGQATGAKADMTEEPFSGLEVGGKTWSGKLVTTKVAGNVAKSWIADNGWFGGVIRTEAAGRTLEPKRYGDDAEPALAWE